MAPEPYNYMDYRAYLQALLVEYKQTTRYFSFRYFARVAGFSSPSYLKMVIDGARNLTPTSIQQVAKAFKLAKRETAYFEALVLFNQARDDKEKELYLERLSALKPKAQLQGIKKDQYEYFTNKLFVTLREMVALPDFQEDPAWIAAKLRANVKPKEVEHALAVLQRLGLVRRNDAGRLIQADASLTTPPEVASLELMQYHRSMLDDAKEALHTMTPELRDVTALTIPIPKDAVAEIKRRVQTFREEILDYINKGSAEYFEVYQLNVQLFPLTRTKS